MKDTDMTSPYIDELSALYNRRYLQEKEAQKINAYVAHNIPFSLVIIDIDHFKEINDTHGHLKGDEIIKEFARFLRSTLRRTDTVIRYGGDEFICMMPRTLRTDAEWVYRRILKGVRERAFSGLKITLSVGIASYPGDGNDFQTLFGVADQVLYDAKRSGRDRIGVVRKKKLALPIKSFVNREKELAIVQELLANSEKRMSVGVVRGKVGVGKTHLSKEALNSVKGKEVIWSDCLYLTDAIAYYPLREALKYRIQRSGTDIFRDISPAYKLELSKLIPELMVEPSVDIDSVLDKYRLYESFRKVIEVGDRPKMIVIDNIQWSDAESLDVLQYLVRSLKDNPITFLFIYRIEEKNEALDSFLSLLCKEVDVTEIDAAPFEYADIHKSVELIIGESPMEQLVEYVAKESGGIPFYVEEIMRVLYDTKNLILEEDQWVFREPGEEIIPKSLADIAIRRYHSLSKEAQAVIDIASVIGWFDTAIIKTLTGFNEGEIAGLINDMNRVHMVKFTKNRYEFAEEISRNALYNSVAAGIQGKTLHQRIGVLLEERYKDKEHDVVEELALHYYRARDKAKGIRYCLEAGDKAHEQYAHQFASRYYTWALELVADEQNIENVKQKIDCLVKRAGIFNVTGDAERALQDLDHALKTSQAIGDRKREANVLYRKVDVYYRTSRYRDMIELGEQCRKIYHELGDNQRIASSLHSIALGYKNLMDYQTALRFIEEALSIAQAAGEKGDEVKILNSQGVVYKNLGDYQNAAKSYARALKILEQLKHDLALRACLSNVGIIKEIMGEYDDALSHFEKALAIAVKTGDRNGEAINSANIGLVKSKLGDYGDSLTFLERSLRITRESGFITGQIASLSISAIVYNKLADYARALSLLEEALTLAKEIEDIRRQADVLGVMGEVHTSLGDYDKARGLFEESLSIAQQFKFEELECSNMLSLGQLSLMMHATKDAKNFINKAYNSVEASRSQIIRKNCLLTFAELYLEQRNYKQFERTVKDIGNLPENSMTPSDKATLDLLRGRYYTMTNDVEKAVHYFNKALAVFKKMGEMLNVGTTYYYLGIMESKRGKKTASKAYIEQSLEIFDSIGAKSWKKRAEKITV